jgi:hypothetical protein
MSLTKLFMTIFLRIYEYSRNKHESQTSDSFSHNNKSVSKNAEKFTKANSRARETENKKKIERIRASHD